MTTQICTSDTWRRVPRSWAERFGEMREMFGFLQDFRISTLNSSRIAAYKAAFEQYEAAALHPRGVGNVRDLTRIMHSAVELDQLATIIRAARASHSTVWRTRLEDLFSGTAFPLEAGSHNSHARDAQFETLVAAVCQLGGYEITFQEPDIQLSSTEAQFGLAAKRPRHLRKLRKNCRKASKQIQDTGLPGMVALELSAAFYPDGCINTNEEVGAAVLLREATNRFFAIKEIELRESCAEHNVFGIVVVLHLPVLIHREGYAAGLTTAVRWGIMPLSDPGDSRLGWIGEFMNRCEIGLFGPRDEMCASPGTA